MEKSVNVAWKDMTSIEDDGCPVYQPAVLIRKVSKFITGTKEDVITPFSILVNVRTGRIFTDNLPFEVAEYCNKYNDTLNENIDTSKANDVEGSKKSLRSSKIHDC